MFLGACRLTKRILIVVVGLCASLNFISCGGIVEQHAETCPTGFSRHRGLRRRGDW